MQAAPYTTPGQLAAAAAMGTISAASGSHPAFVLAAGDNFYMVRSEACQCVRTQCLQDGLPAPLPNAVTATRVAATFQDVYTAAELQVPWYFVGGARLAGSLASAQARSPADAVQGTTTGWATSRRRCC